MELRFPYSGFKSVQNLIIPIILVVNIFASWASAEEAGSLPGFESGIDFDGKTSLSPLAAEIDGNSANGKEIAFTTNEGTVQVYGSDGTLKWTAHTPNWNCLPQASDTVLAAPAAADIDGDGDADIIQPYGGYFSGSTANQNCGGGIAAYDGASGTMLWYVDSVKAARKVDLPGGLPSVVSTPAIADLNADGRLEIAYGSLTRDVFVVRSDGSVAAIYVAADTVFSSAAIADTNADGKLEVIIGTDISQNTKIVPPTKNGGYVYALDFNKVLNKITKKKKKKKKNKKTKSTTVCNFRKSVADGGCVRWITYVAETMQSSPVIAELIPDVAGEEIAIGTGCYFENGAEKNVYILSLKDGKILKSIPTTSCMQTSPAVGDLNGDGQNELIAFQAGSANVLVVNPVSGATVWEAGLHTNSFGHGTQPLVADLDGNGSQEVVAQDGSNIKVFDGVSGAELTCSGSDCESGFTIPISGSTKGPPAIVDLDGDGASELIIATGRLYSFTNLTGLGSSDGVYAPYSASMPMWRVDANRKGNAE